jgi:hypothetical protein
LDAGVDNWARFDNVVCVDGEFGRVDVHLVVDEKEDGGWGSVVGIDIFTLVQYT